MVPPSLSVWTQRLGRAGRSGAPAVVILLVEPSVYKLRKSRGGVGAEDADDEEKDDDEEEKEDGESETEPVDPTYQKKVEEGMRKWIEAIECRRDVADVYFNNPPRTTELVVPCCDICVLKKLADHTVELTSTEADFLALYNRINSREVPVAPANDGETQQGGESSDEDQISRNTNGQATGTKHRRPGSRRKERLEACRNVLMDWRHKTWQNDFKDCVWGPNVLFSDTILTKIANRARIQTLDDIKKEIPEWIWADEYGDAVLKLLEPIDTSWREENDRKKAENKAKRAKVSAEKKAIRDEERLAKAREATVQRRAASTSRPALHQVCPAPNHQNALQPTTTTAYNPVQYYPHPMQYSAAYPVPGYPPLYFIPYHPPNS